MIENLALKGGGVKGIAYIGCLYELEKKGYLKSLKRVSGTSAGAIIALLIALNLKPIQMEKLMRELDFNNFKQGWNPFRIFTKYGLYSGDTILPFLLKCYELSELDINKNTTFKEFVKKGGKEITVFASNLNERNITEFSCHATPDCIVWEAIRASMSIPFYFKSWQFSNGIPNNHIYVDGAVVFNYPLSYFDKELFNEDPLSVNRKSLGLFLEPKKIYEKYQESPLLNESKVKVVKKNYFKKFGYRMSIFKYIGHLFDTLMNAQDIEIFEDKHHTNRTVFVDDLGISAINFDLSDKEKDDLIHSGRVGVQHYFEYLESLGV